MDVRLTFKDAGVSPKSKCDSDSNNMLQAWKCGF